MKKRKFIAFSLIVVLIVSMIFPIDENKKITANDNYSLKNPIKDNDGNTIWDCIYFGKYYQNDISGVVKEPIKWRVLKVDGNDVFLMADKALDTKKWNDTRVGVTWENSTLRSWLNGYGSDSNICGNNYLNDNFIDVAFTEEEQKAIKTSFVENQHDPFYNSPSGNDTYDKVYLLSYTESLNTAYGFSNDIYDGATRVVKNTPYAEAKLEIPSWLTPGWWLRSHGDDTYPDNWEYYGHYAVNVYSSGFVYCNGTYVDSTKETVRPVLHLDIQNKDLFSYAGTVNSGKATEEATTVVNETTVASSETTTVVNETTVATEETTTVVNETTVATEETTAEVETTTILENNNWINATDTWTTDGVWNIWAGNGAIARYKGNDTLDNYYINTTTCNGDWSVQTSTVLTGLKWGTLYTYTITIESDKEGAYVGVREENSNSSLVYNTLSVGENTITGSFSAAMNGGKLFLELGNVVNSGTTFHITGVEIKEYGEDNSEGIPVDGVWKGWFEQEGWANYTISTSTSGYTLTNKDIGSNWYSIQTGIDNVKFKGNVDYTCSFTLDVDMPKQFKVDDRTTDDIVFTEKIPGSWIKNTNGTYSYKYVGTYKNTTNVSQFINIRIALGYFSGEENYSASSKLNCTVSNFVIMPTDEYNKEYETTIPVETTVVETTTVEEDTTIEEPTTSSSTEIIISEDVKIEGFQISMKNEGSRVIGSVEPTINGKNVEKWGFIYAIEQAGDSVFYVPDEEMYFGTNNDKIISMESTPMGTSNVLLGESTTATYFVRTTLFSTKSRTEFSAKYRVRAYALLSDGSYVYSKVHSYNIFDICDKLYQNNLMNSYESHQYIYNNILKIVDYDYKEVDYLWGNIIV